MEIIRTDVPALAAAPVAGERNGNAAFLVTSWGYILVVLLVMRAYRIPFYWQTDVLAGYGLALSSLGLVLLGRLTWALGRDRPRRPARFLWQECRAIGRSGAARCLPVALTYPWLITTYFFLKGSFIRIASFSWDPSFMRLDFAIHRGNPARILIPYLSVPWFAWSLDTLYCLWFVVNSAVLTWMAVSGNLPLRRQFWLSFSLCWVVMGTMVALIFLSAGPRFWDHAVGGENPYADQMSALRTADQHLRLNSVRAQGVIWQLLGLDGKYGGASAMPSMHIVLCTLFTLALWRAHRALGITMLAFTVLTLVACVALGWHYAVDGYVAAAGTLVIWWGAGRFWRGGPGPARMHQ